VKKDFYSILGVSPEAEERKIQKAYLKLARRVHPDVNPGDRQAVVRYREIREAYRILSDRESRDLYDRKGEVSEAAGAEGADAGRRPGSSGPRGWEHLIRDIFHDEAESESEAAPNRGEDIHQVVEVDFREALEGTRKEIHYQREVACGECHGTRFASDSRMGTCPDCRGSGLAQVRRGLYMVGKICHRCGGAGRTGSRPCQTCGGKGTRLRREKKTLRIPAGVDSGSRVVLRGGGQPGSSGGGRGDLVVTLRVLPHPHLERRMFNLFCSVPVTVTEAALGAEVLVPRLEEKVALKIPAGTQGGQEFRLRGRGVPHPGGTRRGDLFVSVEVVIPEARDPGARRLFRELEKLFPDNPRVRA